MSNISLTELFDIDVLQRIQDAFSEYTGLAAIITNPDGIPVTKPSGFTYFCTNLTRSTRAGLLRCMECDSRGAFGTLEKGEPFVYKCHAGLYDFAAPIMLEDMVIGCFIGGQAADEEIDGENLRNTAVSLGIDPQEYADAAKRVKHMAMADIERAATFLFKISKAMSLMAYRSYTLIKQSKRVERDARIKAGYFVSNITSKIKAEMAEWLELSLRLLEGFGGTDSRKIINELENKCSEVCSSITDIVEYLKESEDIADFEESPYSLSGFFGRIADKLKKSCEEKNNEFFLNIDREAPDIVFGNEKYLRYIIEKLTVNAVRYTENGRVEVCVSTEKTYYSENLLITVSDTGVGMTEEELEDIRVHLYGLNAVEPSRSEASKMGFSLIGTLMRRMSGRISVESVKGEGSVFRISLPQLAIKGE